MKKVNNLPEYAKDAPYIVAREVDGELWFYGAFPGIYTAMAAEKEIPNGVILKNLGSAKER
jgi:hypothetical protein